MMHRENLEYMHAHIHTTRASESALPRARLDALRPLNSGPGGIPTAPCRLSPIHTVIPSGVNALHWPPCSSASPVLTLPSRV